MLAIEDHRIIIHPKNPPLPILLPTETPLKVQHI
jgi:hypothetical protein